MPKFRVYYQKLEYKQFYMRRYQIDKYGGRPFNKSREMARRVRNA